jgi:hypothetical protein
LLVNQGVFTAPLNPAMFRVEVMPLLSRNGINRLVLFLNQFEDIVSPRAGTAAMNAMQRFLGELWEQRETKRYLRAVVVYALMPMCAWGGSGRKLMADEKGFPYPALECLSCSVAETIIRQTAHEQRWRLEPSVSDIMQQLVLESQKPQFPDEIFPVYLQSSSNRPSRILRGVSPQSSSPALGGVAGLSSP